jgi:hypothetical protein
VPCPHPIKSVLPPHGVVHQALQRSTINDPFTCTLRLESDLFNESPGMGVGSVRDAEGCTWEGSEGLTTKDVRVVGTTVSQVVSIPY